MSFRARIKKAFELQKMIKHLDTLSRQMTEIEDQAASVIFKTNKMIKEIENTEMKLHVLLDSVKHIIKESTNDVG